MIRPVSLGLIILFLFTLTVPRYAQDSPPEPDIYSVEQAETLLAEGLAQEALKMLEKLDAELKASEQGVRLYILRIRAYLALNDKDKAENVVREIYRLDLTDRIQMEDLAEEIRFLFDKVRPEYWFTLKEEKTDEEAFDRLVIQQHSRKPKKKTLLPKLILGTVLVGAVVAAVMFIASSSGKKDDTGDFGTLKFENLNYWDVSIEIYGIVKNAPGTHHNTYGRPHVNFAYVDLPPGTHTLTVTSTLPFSGETEVFVYSIEIVTSQTNHFMFRHQ